MTTYRLTDSLDEAQRAQDAGVDVWCLLEPNAVADTAGTTSTRLPCCNEHVAVWTCRRRFRRDRRWLWHAAAFALGAAGVWMGTRFISSTECPCHGVCRSDVSGYGVWPRTQALR